ncbi:MAG: hypothetical protein GC131_00590 [Alphaproteobacteria bacterium]|nr:hypothetical protein [Alphaproteobacteria bacterium]
MFREAAKAAVRWVTAQTVMTFKETPVIGRLRLGEPGEDDRRLFGNLYFTERPGDEAARVAPAVASETGLRNAAWNLVTDRLVHVTGFSIGAFLAWSSMPLLGWALATIAAVQAMRLLWTAGNLAFGTVNRDLRAVHRAEIEDSARWALKNPKGPLLFERYGQKLGTTSGFAIGAGVTALAGVKLGVGHGLFQVAAGLVTGNGLLATGIAASPLFMPALLGAAGIMLAGAAVYGYTHSFLSEKGGFSQAHGLAVLGSVALAIAGFALLPMLPVAPVAWMMTAAATFAGAYGGALTVGLLGKAVGRHVEWRVRSTPSHNISPVPFTI